MGYKSQVWNRLTAEIGGSNPAEGMDSSPFVLCR